MKKIDLNSDLGEGFGEYKMGLDDEVIKLVSSANIACGLHASDPMIMSKTVKMARDYQAGVGAHPGFPDLIGFGRRNIAFTPSEAKEYVQYQIGALNAFCAANGIKMQHVKPHGALYNMAGKDYALARAICEGIYEIDNGIILLGLSGSEMIKAARDIGLRAALEVFADRAYEPDGSLVARNKPGAMIEDENEMIERVVRMVLHGKVKAINGEDIDIKADSICVHGDGAKALDFVKRIRRELKDNDIEIKPLNEII